MNVIVVGSGGREHTLCYTLSKSKYVDKIYAIPGNPGIQEIATCVDINPLDNLLIKKFAFEKSVELIIPGSEEYLENGIANEFKDTSIIVFGPTKEAAKIESSKEFAKDLMKKYDIPTAEYQVFGDYQKALDYIDEKGVPIVIKYDGLAGGKGVVVALTKNDAINALQVMLLEKKYGNSKVVIEEYLEGPEFSLMCFVHGGTVIPMPLAQDHKRLLDGDKGPNTGGMGIYSPVPIISKETINDAFCNIMKKVANALINEGASFTGFLYGGLMQTNKGPKVIEFNARFGDPEAEVILPKLKTDIIDVIKAVMSNNEIHVEWDDCYYVGVVLASMGYPKSYQKGFVINGLDRVKNLVFHMGTKIDGEHIKTNGGRVLLVTGTGDTIEQAIKDTYQQVEKIQCENLVYRKDIGNKSIKRV